MQLTWYICHTSLSLNTQLIQLRRAKHSKTKKPEKLLLHLDQTHTPTSATLKQLDADTGHSDHLMTESIKPIYQAAERIAQADPVTVLIKGASGTGKEHLARYIHDQSARCIF